MAAIASSGRPQLRAHERRRREVLGPERSWSSSATERKTTSATPVDVGRPQWSGRRDRDRAVSHVRVLRSGGIDCWGSNGAGQLGDGTTTDRLRPATVVGLRDREGDAVDRLAFGGRDPHALCAGRRALRRSGALPRDGHAQRLDGRGWESGVRDRHGGAVEVDSREADPASVLRMVTARSGCRRASPSRAASPQRARSG